jgi:hypothetical protein
VPVLSGQALFSLHPDTPSTGFLDALDEGPALSTARYQWSKLPGWTHHPVSTLAVVEVFTRICPSRQDPQSTFALQTEYALRAGSFEAPPGAGASEERAVGGRRELAIIVWSPEMSAISVQFIGSGDAFASGGRLQTSILVNGPDVRFAIDFGTTSLVGLRQQDIDPNTIDAIFLTHLHGDHCGGVPFLLLDAKRVVLTHMHTNMLEHREEAAQECADDGYVTSV